ncbi:MAG: hypothetical protein EA401_00545, partial [Planctomycetota bacterium]
QLVFSSLRHGDADAARRARSQRKLVKRQLDQLSSDADQHLTSRSEQLAPLYRLESQVVNILRTHHASLRRAAKLMSKQRVAGTMPVSEAQAVAQIPSADTTHFYRAGSP